MPQRNHRVHLRRAPRRHKTSSQSHSYQQHRYSGKSDRISGADSEQQARHHAGQRKRRCQTGAQTGKRQGHSLSRYQADDVTPLRSERNPNAYLVCALRD